MDIEYLSMTSKQDCGKFFKGYTTPFDIYIARKSNTKNFITEICGIDGKVYSMCIKDMKFIPNIQCEDLEKILAKPEETPVNFLYERSHYGTDKPSMYNVDGVKTAEFKYPCVYMISRDETQRGENGGKLTLRYSNKKKNDKKTGKTIHFGTPKVIFGISHESGIPFVDRTGMYGLTGFIGGISDDIENLDTIARVMDSSRFRKIMAAVRFNTEDWSRNVIRLFRKDFWTEFVDQDGNLINSKGEIIDRDGNLI